MKKGQDTRGYERYLALDIHREYILLGGWNEEKDWVLTPRRVSIEKFPEWAKKNIRPGDIVVLETTTFWRPWRVGYWWPMHPKWERLREHGSRQIKKISNVS